LRVIWRQSFTGTNVPKRLDSLFIATEMRSVHIVEKVVQVLTRHYGFTVNINISAAPISTKAYLNKTI